MANVTIDGKEYNVDDLSDQAKEQLVSLQFTQGEIRRLESLLAVARTAGVAYSAQLKKEIGE